MTPPLYAVIMAGGSGTRLWPLSRQSRPKQVLRLMGERTLYQMAIDRLTPMMPPERIIVITTADLADTLESQAPEIPAANIVVEPEGRGTAPVIGLGALMAEQRAGGEAVIACLTADHYIRDVEKFRSVLSTAAQVAVDGAIVTLGIAPTFASTGFGYIQRGRARAALRGFEVYEVAQFKEKPDADVAAQFVADGMHSWNSGMFVWSTRRVRAEFERQLPETAAGLSQIGAALGTPAEGETLLRLWPSIPRQTIDYGIMEGADDVAVIPIDIGWSDVGSWASLLDILPPDECGNVVLDAQHYGIDTERTLVCGERLVATIGLRDTIIVDTPDALLVCTAERAQDVRQVVERLQKNGKDYL